MSAKKEKKWVIEYAGLSKGEHTFELDVDGSFFDDIEHSEFKKGAFKVTLTVLKRLNMMTFDFDVKGYVEVECDRCADEFNFTLNEQYKLIVQIGGGDSVREDDDIITVGVHEHNIDLRDYLYEYISLSLPIKREHLDVADCNQDVISVLEEYRVEDIIEEQEEVSDPRWAGLKDIKLE